MGTQYLALGIHKELKIVGLKGMLSRDLTDAARELVASGLEVASVRHEANPRRDFLAAFQTAHPVVDLTIDQLGSGESAVIAYTLNRDAAFKLIDGVVKRISFSPDREHDEVFAGTIRREMPLEEEAYARLEEISQRLNSPLETVFATVRYINFLVSYRTLPIGEAQRIACEMYGLRLPQS